MKSIVLTIQPKQELIIPLSHYHALQGLVYELISYDSALSMELHTKKSGKTDALKLFCFSDLYGKYRYSDRTRTYPGPFRFEIRCAEDIIVDTIAERITHDPMIMVDGCVCRISDLITYSKSFLDAGLDLHMNTPISVYRTDCDKKRRYFSPEEDEFYELVSNNLKKKYLLIYGHAYGEELLLSCPSPGRSKHVVARYKGDIVNAYYGDYRIEATPEMLAVAYYCGLGSKNSIGFGFAELRSEHHIN